MNHMSKSKNQQIVHVVASNIQISCLFKIQAGELIPGSSKSYAAEIGMQVNVPTIFGSMQGLKVPPVPVLSIGSRMRDNIGADTKGGE